MPFKQYSVSEFAGYSYEWGKETFIYIYTTIEGKNKIRVLSSNIGQSGTAEVTQQNKKANSYKQMSCKRIRKEIVILE